MNVFEFDKVHEECGVFGFYNRNDYNSCEFVYYGLYSLQHRGQENCGIACNNNGNILFHKDLGLVSEVFKNMEFNYYKGNIAIGHVRYSTSGSSFAYNSQPLVVNYRGGQLALSHNGNLVNSDILKQQLIEKGSIFHTTTDSEVIAYLIASEHKKEEKIEITLKKLMKKLKGSFALVITIDNKLIGIRDPYGIRPLSIGILDDSYVLSSETCAFDTIGAKFVRDVEPGEIVVIDENTLTSISSKVTKSHLCVFEYIYFARPDSFLEGLSVYDVRKNIGAILAKEHNVNADVVIGVPDSGTTFAIGYSQESGIPYREGLIRNRYIGRTFIQPEQNIREHDLKIKLNIVKNNIKDKKVIVVDDSIVRGTTMKRIVKLLKDFGAKEVHIRIGSPEFNHPCYFGTDVPSDEELITKKYTKEYMCEYLEADSIEYLSNTGLKSAFDCSKSSYCDGCFSGDYPIKIEKWSKYE